MNQLPARRFDLTFRIVEDEVVILDRGTGNLHRLNATAGTIWQHCDGRSTLDEISARVAAEFDKDLTEVREAVRATIEDFEQLGLLSSNLPPAV